MTTQLSLQPVSEANWRQVYLYQTYPVNTITLSVEDNNHAAILLYKEQGFQDLNCYDPANGEHMFQHRRIV